MDAFGNLIAVYEQDPALGTVSTSYGYDVLNHLVQVYMPRGTTTQTRSFNYTKRYHRRQRSCLAPPTLRTARSATPTKATATSTSKTDAKGQQLTYLYDSYNRLTSVNRANAPGSAQVLRTYYYDTNPLDSTGTYSQYAAGRLTAVQYCVQQPYSAHNPLAPGADLCSSTCTATLRPASLQPSACR